MSNTSPLQGITVIDLTQFGSGPTATLTLAQMGADIIKIERPVKGEQGRPKGGGQDLLWAVLHANKKSITLDLKSDEGKKIFDRLLKLGDVVIENFAPGTFKKMGYDWEKIHALNPRMIYCDIKGYAEESPYSKYPAFDGPVQATGTFAAMTGDYDGPPTCSGVALADDLAGHYAATGIMAAILQRTHSGEGQYVRINMQEVVFTTARMAFSNPTLFVDDPGYLGEDVGRGTFMKFAGTNAPVRMFKTKPRGANSNDDYVFVCVLESAGIQPWKNLCHLIGKDEWADDPEYATGAKRAEKKKEICDAVQAWTIKHDKEEAMEILCGEHITAGAVITIKDLVRNGKWLYENHTLEVIDHPVLGRITIPGCAYHMSDNYVPMKPSPALGEHNSFVYKELLGMSDEEMEGFRSRGVI